MSKPIAVDEGLRSEIAGWLIEAGQRLCAQVPSDQRRRAELKGHGDFVTALERQIEGGLYNGVAHSPYAARIIAEESWSGGRPNLNGACWVIDPLDSTAGYLFEAGPMIPSIMMAYCFDGQPLVAGIHFPLTSLTITACLGRGLKLYGQARPWPTVISNERAAVDLSEAWVDVNRYADDDSASNLVLVLDCSLRSPRGAALVTSLVPHSGIVWSLITGQPNISAVVHDNGPGKVKQAVWDVLPAKLILEEAGGCMVSLDSGRDYDAQQPEPFLAAVSSELALEILELAH